MKSKYQREWEYQQRRYERAERKARKHIRLTDAWIKIMIDATNELERLCREEEAEE